jgi:hypothetical protein
LIDEVNLRSEWRLFKRLATSNFKSLTNNEVWALMQKDYHQVQYPNVIKLATIAHLLPISTAVCERAFSYMKMIKNNFRSNLSN